MLLNYLVCVGILNCNVYTTLMGEIQMLQRPIKTNIPSFTDTIVSVLVSRVSVDFPPAVNLYTS